MSCSFTRYSIGVFEERGLKAVTYMAGIPYPVEHLLDAGRTVSWDSYCRLMQNGTQGWSTEEFSELGRRYSSHNAGELIRAMSRLFFTPAEAYRYIIQTGPDRFFTCIHHVVEEVGDDVLLVDSIVAAPYEPYPEQFTIALGALKSLPSMYGLADAAIDFEPTERGARYTISLPRGASPLSWLRRLVSWPLRGRTARRDLQAAFAELQVRHQALQERFEAHKIGEAERSRLAKAIEQSSDGIAVVGPDGRIVFANAALAEMMGSAGPEQVVGESTEVLARGAGDEKLLEEIATTVGCGAAWKGRYQSIWEDGSSHVRDASITPMKVDGSEEVFLVAVVHDVTREAELDDTLQQRQRMESVGKLAGGVAHDFNNLLTVILGFAEVLKDPNASPEESGEAVREITRAATSAADLTGQLLAFGRKQVSRPVFLDLNEAVREIGGMLSRLIGERIELQMHLDAAPASVYADPVQIEQVVTNLVVNARDAMPNGGTVSLATRLVSADEVASMDVRLEACPHVVLEVGDTGVGMDALTSSQAFEPFFTTKDPGRGTGLGLATVYGIVQQAGGEIRIRSGVGLGTTVEIYLPQSLEAVAQAAPRSASAPERPAAGTVLLVEDEQAVRRIVRIILEEAGLRVIACANGRDALEIARETPVEYLVSDVVMPHLGGIELARRLREIQPEVRTILMSGYPAPGAQEVEPPPGAVILAKPFTSAKLHAALRATST